MQVAPDASTVDLTHTSLRLRSNVILTPQLYGGATYYHIEVPAEAKFYRIGFDEYVFVSLLDGRTTFSEALALTARSQGPAAFDQQQALQLYTWLLENDIATFAQDDPADRPSKPAQNRWAEFLPKLNPFWIKIPFGKPDELLRLLQPTLGWIFSPMATIAGVLLMITAGIQLHAQWDEFVAASASVFAPDNWLWLLIAWVLLKMVHELAHGLVCQRYGGQVRETGIMLAFFAPLAYVDVTSCWAFSSKWKRIHTAAAGMYVELILAAIAVLAWPAVTTDVGAHLLYNVIVMASISTLLFNANPLMRFDGYYMLSDLLQIPNLQTQANQATQQMINRALFGSSNGQPVVTGRNLWILRSYGVAAFGWRFLISASMMIAASVLFHGAGVILSLAGTVAWFAVPIVRTVKQWSKAVQDKPARLLRAGIAGSVPVALVALAFWCPAPVVMTAPGIVSLQEGCVIRSDVSGFIEQLHVRDGQSVNKGDVLLTLRNRDVTVELEDLEHQIQQEIIRRQTAMQDHDAGLAAVAEGNLQSMQSRYTEASTRATALTVCAATDGYVLTRGLESRLDTYVEEGDELLVIDDQQPRELRVSVAQEDYADAVRLVDQPVYIRLGTRRPLSGRLTRVIPRASHRLANPALAATNGGPLSVVEADEEDAEEIQLADARFEAIVSLETPDSPQSTASPLPIGERGYASLGLVRESLGMYAWRSASSWLTDQIETAAAQTRL